MSSWGENRRDIDALLQQGPIDFFTPFGQRSLDVWQRGCNVVCVKEIVPEQMLVLCCYLQAAQSSFKVCFRPLSGDFLTTAEEYDLIEDCELVTGADLYRSAREIPIDNRVIEWSGQRIKLMLGNCVEVLPPSAVVWTRHAATKLPVPLRSTHPAPQSWTSSWTISWACDSCRFQMRYRNVEVRVWRALWKPQRRGAEGGSGRNAGGAPSIAINVLYICAGACN